MKSCIYGLYDEHGRLRYIGKANNPAKRLSSHLRDARRRNTPVYAWIRKHGCPEMRILIENSEDWREDEKRLIALHKPSGYLLNLAEGGDEPYCSLDVRRANGVRAVAARTKSARSERLWRLKRMLGDNIKRGFVSENTKAKIRAAVITHPEHFAQWVNI